MMMIADAVDGAPNTICCTLVDGPLPQVDRCIDDGTLFLCYLFLGWFSILNIKGDVIGYDTTCYPTNDIIEH
jgi:hypothetical protein